jgi:hypothetical protein
MIHVIDCSPLLDEQVFIDDYSLSVEWKKYYQEHYYVRVGTSSKSLFEIRIEGANGLISSVDLVISEFVSELPKQETNYRAKGVTAHNGLPVCHLDEAWEPSTARNDLPVDFNVGIGRDFIRITLGENLFRNNASTHTESISSPTKTVTS